MEAALEAARKRSSTRVYRVLRLLATEARLEANEAAGTARIGMAGSGQVRIEVSPSFLRRHVRSDGDALFLLLHELMHRLRGDFCRRSSDGELSADALNVALDLLVNAHLLRFAFAEPPAILGSLYSADRFPQNLLLPPSLMARRCRRRDGRWARFDRPHGELVRTYGGRRGASRCRLVELVEGQLRRSGAPDPGRLADLYLRGWLTDVPRSVWIDEAASMLANEFPSLRALLSRVVVLGDHEAGKLLGSVADVFGSGWPSGRGERVAEEVLGRIESVEERVFFEAVRRAVCRDERTPTSRLGSIPSPAPVGEVGRREAMFLASGWRRCSTGRRRWGEESSERVHVYLDVSVDLGLAAVVLRADDAAGDRIGSPVYLFSNVVEPVTLAELSAAFRERRGTDFDCVLSHALERDFRRILVVADGAAELNDRPPRPRRRPPPARLHGADVLLPPRVPDRADGGAVVGAAGGVEAGEGPVPLHGSPGRPLIGRAVGHGSTYLDCAGSFFLADHGVLTLSGAPHPR